MRKLEQRGLFFGREIIEKATQFTSFWALGGGGETVENLTLVLVKAVAEIMQIFCRIGKFEIETVMRYTR